jgi:DNA primase
MSIFSQPAAALGLAALLGSTLPAAAQSARYCDGNLVANSFYSNVLQGQGGANVEYHGQFQNQDPQRRNLAALMIRIQRIGAFTVIRQVERIELNPYEQKDVVLLSVHANNPGGQGAPTPAMIGQTIRFVCNYSR